MENGRRMRIIGMDPGLRTMGWGIVDVDGSRVTHVANGSCKSEGPDLAVRLASLFRQLERIVQEYDPDQAAVERVFVNKDPVATLKLGQARGVCLMVPALNGVGVHEYAPNTVKRAVVGVGHAEKVQVEQMVRLLLPGAISTGHDASDALALAICHAHHAQTAGRLEAVLAGTPETGTNVRARTGTGGRYGCQG